jgi:hypothetical protein
VPRFRSVLDFGRRKLANFGSLDSLLTNRNLVGWHANRWRERARRWASRALEGFVIDLLLTTPEIENFLVCGQTFRQKSDTRF